MTAVLCPYWVFLVVSMVVFLWHKGYTPLLVGFLIDAQFGFLEGYMLWYLFGACVVAILTEMVRPYIYVERLS